jgi:hypothetical protein
VNVKQLLAAACIALTPVSAWAEHGTQLSEWSSSSPNQTPDPTPPPATPPAPAPAPAAEATKEGEKKDDKGPATITAVATPEQIAAVTGFTFAASLDHNLGAGTFIDAGKYASLGASLDLSARYSFKLGGIKLGVSGRGVVAYEYTLPDSANGRRVSWRDLSFGLSAPAVYKETFSGIGLTPSLSATVPITLESWAATTITVLSANLNFTRSISRFDLSLSLGGSRGFHQRPEIAAQANQRTDPANNRVELARFGENLAATAGTNTAWTARGTFAATLHVTEELTFDASYSLAAVWKYEIAPVGDQYTPKALDSTGQPVACEGICRGKDIVTTSVAANYQLSDHWGVTLYIQSQMPAKSDDNKNFRFPFWSFEGAANNYSSLGLALSANF